ncbi:N-6 DNA methylase [Flagellimonas oceanensis]|uniref:N-6 DNA methylase n=1 Tax=Flagellimonas oceanensis TaxID=2499163 RepID=UPI000F8ECB86|nr:N-6 DNA methylase [Allomuricauda oceanensis]
MSIDRDIQINQIQRQLSHIIDILRYEPIDSGSYYVVFYFISLISEDKLVENVFLDANLFKKELKYRVSNSIFKGSYNDEIYYQIHDVFHSTIETLSDRALNEILWILRGIERPIFLMNYSQIFDDLLYRISSSEGRKAGESIQPKELTQFFKRLVDLKPVRTIYNPFSGMGSFGIVLDARQEYYGQEIDKKTWAIGILRMIAHGKFNFQLKREDSVNQWNPDNRNYDLIIAHPPFNLKLRNPDINISSRKPFVEEFLISNGIKDLTESGRLISIVPTSFLHRSSRPSLQLRQMLVENDILETVISFPGGLLSNTGVPFAIVIINKDKATFNSVHLIDATKFQEEGVLKQNQLNYDKLIKELESVSDGHASRKVSNQKIAAENFNLNVFRYFLPEIEGVKFSDFSNFIKARPFDGLNNNQLESYGESEFPLVRVKDLKDDNLDFILKAEDVDQANVTRSGKLIEESCLLLSLKWKTLKPTYFKYEGKPILISPDIVSLRIDESIIDITYLINELSSEYIQDQLRAYRVGAVMQFIRRKDLMDIVIRIPDLHFQNRFVESIEVQKAKVEGIVELSNKLKRLQEERNALEHGITVKDFDEFASLKHSLGTPRQNILSSAEILLLFLENNKEDFKEINTKYRDLSGQNIEETLRALKSNVNYMSELLEKGENGLILENYPLENVPIIEIQKIIEQVDTGLFNFKLKLEGITSENKRKLGILCNRTLFQVLIEEIFNNAHKYGFSNKRKENLVVVDLTVVVDETLGNRLVVDIRNNGLPFPENFSKSNFTAKYSTSNFENGGTGIGGYDIDRIARYFKNDKWELLLNEDTIYPVRFKFEFPIIIND